MIDVHASATLNTLAERELLERFASLVRQDRTTTAALLAHIGEIDRRKLYLKHACPSMFAFCVERFHMSEAIAAKRVRAGRTAYRFSLILDMVEKGELHLTGVHQLAAHLTEENHLRVLKRAKHKTMREIERLVAELAPRPDAPSRIVTLPSMKQTKKTQNKLKHAGSAGSEGGVQSLGRVRAQVTPLSPRRYKLQVTLSQEMRDKLTELQELLSHQIPDEDPAKIVDRAFDALLDKARRQRAAHAEKPRRNTKRGKGESRDIPSQAKRVSRAVPAQVKREVFKRDGGQCAFVDERNRRCSAKRFIEYHHRRPYARGGGHEHDNVELRCRAHNQYEADRDYGELFMTERRRL